MEEYPLWDHSEFLANGLNLKNKKDRKRFWREMWLHTTKYRFPIRHQREWKDFFHAMERQTDSSAFDKYFCLIATTATDCAPTGIIQIGQRTFEAKSEAGFINAFKEVRITGYDINLLTIKPLDF